MIRNSLIRKWLFLLVAEIGLMVSVRAQAPLPTAPRTPILTLGVFHFSYPGRDSHKTSTSEQIDVLQPRYQQELEELTARLQQFRPTHILVEEEPAHQARLDSLYKAYCAGRYQPGPNETYQLGFRLARRLGLPRVWAVDTDGDFSSAWQQRLRDTARLRAFMRYYEHNPDSSLLRQYKRLYVHQDQLAARYGIGAALAALNQPAALRSGQGPYLLGAFDYEEASGDYTGADFEVGRWYSRNLRILRNVRRIPRTPGTRLLLVMGAGHIGLLNELLLLSPQYELVRPAAYLPKSPAK
ncbi:DUF5694 domain-containing protein [Hymenobacter sp. APR13]|uniref:DUF5694 domain-containing protein n=1 Tax=Hymenobacter sp. APR13 TaxID=1356852 RepID=UPI0004E091C0|nr:DUF5694 domain-containing protein [Hymenobacter sp. APR13]AII51412.1 hypothetical protein N008_05360 [Hymenobacter sp. APR13]